MALALPFIASLVAQMFVDNVLKLHGMPATIVINRESISLSVIWKKFFNLQGSKLCMSSGYQPQTDGQTEWSIACKKGIRMQANKHRTEKEFYVGDFVYLSKFSVLFFSILHIPPLLQQDEVETQLRLTGIYQRLDSSGFDFEIRLSI
ncbi:uncharacterized protein [Malus domestica]|uniref:uncharacterized protein n=1 Tax=Malus domestica TaxID=3750 RepID=UPI0039767B5C